MQRRPGSRRLLRLSRGTLPACPGSQPRCYRVGAPAAMDLGPSRLTFTWGLEGGNAYPQADEELWVQPLTGGAGRLLDVGGAGECGFGGPNGYSFRLFTTPSVSHARVSYLAQWGDCWITTTILTRAGPSWRTRAELDSRSASLPRTIAYDAARDATGWWSVRGAKVTVLSDGSESDACGTGGCPLVHTTHVTLKTTRVRRRPRPPLEDSAGM